MEYCIADAKKMGKSSVCMLWAEKQKAWLLNQAFAKKFKFKTIDTNGRGYRLLALSLDGTMLKLRINVKKRNQKQKA